MIQMIEEQQLLLLPLSQPHPHPLLDEDPQPPQKNKRMMIHQKLLPLLLQLQLLLQPHPLFGLVLLQSLQPQLDKSPIKASKKLIIVYGTPSAWPCFRQCFKFFEKL